MATFKVTFKNIETGRDLIVTTRDLVRGVPLMTDERINAQQSSAPQDAKAGDEGKGLVRWVALWMDDPEIQNSADVVITTNNQVVDVFL